MFLPLPGEGCCGLKCASIALSGGNPTAMLNFAGRNSLPVALELNDALKYYEPFLCNGSLYTYCVEGWIPEGVLSLKDHSGYVDLTDANNGYVFIKSSIAFDFTGKLWIRKKTLQPKKSSEKLKSSLTKEVTDVIVMPWFCFLTIVWT